jgi:hypothetical protein
MSEAGSIPMGVKERQGEVERRYGKPKSQSGADLAEHYRLAQAIKLIRLRGRVTPAG